jgi:hypothetical protein
MCNGATASTLAAAASVAILGGVVQACYIAATKPPA